MKNNILKMSLIGLCGITVLRPSFAQENIHPFVGATLGTSINFYDMDIGKKYGVPYSTFSSDSSGFTPTYGLNAGIRFLDNSHIYHPGFNLFFEQISDPVKLEVALGYGQSVTIDGDSTHNITGIEFDNYIRVANNERFFDFGNCDTFLVFGLDIGKIKSEYMIENVSLSESGTVLGIKIDGLWEFKNGIGVSIGIRWLKTNDMEAISSILSSRFGLRYTF